MTPEQEIRRWAMEFTSKFTSNGDGLTVGQTIGLAALVAEFVINGISEKMAEPGPSRVGAA
jgi:hypothetical protein